MEINKVLEIMFQLIILPVIPLVVVYAKKFIEVKINDLQAKTDSVVANKYLQMAEESIVKAVEMVSQTYVDALKKDNEFDLQAQEVAFNKAKDVFELLITDNVKRYIAEACGDYNTWVKASIESVVKADK